MNFIVDLFKLIFGAFKLLFETVRVAAFVTNKAAEGMAEVANELERETREYADKQSIERALRRIQRQRDRESQEKLPFEREKDISSSKG